MKKKKTQKTIGVGDDVEAHPSDIFTLTIVTGELSNLHCDLNVRLMHSLE